MLRADISFADFKRKFLSFYWGIQKQDELRNKLMNGEFNPRGKLGPEEYFLELGQTALLLDPPLSKPETIDMTLRHLPIELRNALIVARPSTFEETVVLLR